MLIHHDAIIHPSNFHRKSYPMLNHIASAILQVAIIVIYTTARVVVLRICVKCAFPTRCTCVEFKLRMKRKSTYFKTHEYSLAALKRVSTIKYAFLSLANQIVLLQRSDV